jgi:hypothetical protein
MKDVYLKHLLIDISEEMEYFSYVLLEKIQIQLLQVNEETIVFHFFYLILGELLGVMWDRFVTRENAVVIVATMGNNGKTLDSDTYLNGGGGPGKFIDDRTLPFNQPLKQE